MSFRRIACALIAIAASVLSLPPPEYAAADTTPPGPPGFRIQTPTPIDSTQAIRIRRLAQVPDIRERLFSKAIDSDLSVDTRLEAFGLVLQIDLATNPGIAAAERHRITR